MKRAICLLLAMVVCFSMFSGCGNTQKRPVYENKANVQYSDFEPLLLQAIKATPKLEEPTKLQIESWVESESTTRANFYFRAGPSNYVKAVCRILHHDDGPKYIVDSLKPDPFHDLTSSEYYWLNSRAIDISRFEAGSDFPAPPLASPDIQDFLVDMNHELLASDKKVSLKVREIISSEKPKLEVVLFQGSSIDFLKFANLFCEKFEKDRTYQSIQFTQILRSESTFSSGQAYFYITLRPEGDTLVSMLNLIDTYKPNEFDRWKKLYLSQSFFAKHDFNVRLGHASRPATKNDAPERLTYYHKGAKVIDVKNPYLSVYTDPLGVLDRDIEIGHTICRMLPSTTRYIVKEKTCLFVIPVSNDPQPDELREAYRAISNAANILKTWNFSTLPRPEIDFEIITEDAREIFVKCFNDEGREYLNLAVDEFKNIMQPIIDEEEGKQP